MQTLKRAVLVGETTGGGANPSGELQLGADLLMFLPVGKARSPITGANWEGVGVTPEIAAPADQALKVALEKLGEKPASAAIASLSQASLFQVRNTPLPGTEAALRRMIETEARGQPEYDRYSPALAQATRDQWGDIQAMSAAMGPLQSATFRGPDMFGGDSFEVRFAKGAGIYSIRLAPDGKVDSAGFSQAAVAPRTATPARPEAAPKSYTTRPNVRVGRNSHLACRRVADRTAVSLNGHRPGQAFSMNAECGRGKGLRKGEQPDVWPAHLERGNGQIVAAEYPLAAVDGTAAAESVEEIDYAAVGDGERSARVAACGLFKPIHDTREVLCAAFSAWDRGLGFEPRKGLEVFGVQGSALLGREALEDAQAALGDARLGNPATQPQKPRRLYAAAI
jgi:hypothetical protein